MKPICDKRYLSVPCNEKPFNLVAPRAQQQCSGSTLLECGLQDLILPLTQRLHALVYGQDIKQAKIPGAHDYETINLWWKAPYLTHQEYSKRREEFPLE